MALFDGLFSPGTGLLGQLTPPGYMDQDAANALVSGYPMSSPGLFDGINLGGMIRPGSFLDQFGQRPTAPGLFGETPAPDGQLLQPGSFLDRLINGAQPAASPAPAAQPAAPMTPAAPATPDAPTPFAAGIRPEQFAGGLPASIPSPAIPQALPPQAPTMPPQARNAMAQAAPVTPQQPQAAPSLPSPGPLDRLGAGFMGFTNASSPMQALGNLVGGIATGQRQDPTGRALANASSTATAMYHALVQRGMPAETAVAVAQSVATNPKLAEAVLPQALGLKPPATMEAFFAEQADKAARSGQQFDPGQAYNNYLKFVQEKNAAEKAGTTQGERTANAQIDLPGAVSQAQEQIRLIEELRHHPGRNQPGWNDFLGKAPLIPGTKGYDAEVLLNQIKGGAFLEAFKTLKGGGQITEVEGKKATDAIARMDRAQTRAEFDKALTDYEGIIRLGIDRAAQMAGRTPPNGFRGNAAAPGTYDWTPGGGLRPRQ